MRALVILLLFTAAPVLAKEYDNVPDAYHDYAQQVIPLTFSVAEKEAYLREFALFTESTSELQRYLVEAGASVQEVMSLLPQTSKATSCARKAGGFDPVQTMDELRIAQRLRRAGETTKARLADYRKWRPSMDTICDDAQRFEKYKAKDLEFAIVRLTRAYGDGRVFVGIGFSGEALSAWLSVKAMSTQMTLAADGGFEEFAEGVLNLFTFGGYSAAKNNSQMRRVSREHARIQREMVQDADYQAAAKMSCKAIRDKHSATLEELDRVSIMHERWLAELPEDLLARREGFFRACFSQYENEFLAYLKEKTSGAALAARAEAAKVASIQKLSIETNGRLIRNRILLEKTGCGPGMAYVQVIRNDLAAARLWNLPALKTVAPKAEQAVTEYLKKCRGAL